MKKIKRLLVVAALGLIIGATAKVQTQAAVTGVKQIDDSKNSVKLQCNAILGAGYYYLELSTDNRNWVVMDVSSNPSSLSASSLTSGTTYYARVGTCTDYNYSAGLVAVGKANVSASSYSSGDRCKQVRTDRCYPDILYRYVQWIVWCKLLSDLL